MQVIVQPKRAVTVKNDRSCIRKERVTMRKFFFGLFILSVVLIAVLLIALAHPAASLLADGVIPVN